MENGYNILDSSEPNKEELKFYLDHLVSGDAPEEEIVDALKDLKVETVIIVAPFIFLVIDSKT